MTQQLSAIVGTCNLYSSSSSSSEFSFSQSSSLPKSSSSNSSSSSLVSSKSDYGSGAILALLMEQLKRFCLHHWLARSSSRRRWSEAKSFEIQISLAVTTRNSNITRRYMNPSTAMVVHTRDWTLTLAQEWRSL